MKRPVLWASVMFALGEVTYLYTDKIIQISMLFSMLVCCVFFSLKLKGKSFSVVIPLSLFIVGFLHCFFYESRQELKHYFINQNSSLSVNNVEENYSIKNVGGKNSYSEYAIIYGEVASTKKTDTQMTVVIKVEKTELDKFVYLRDYKVIIYGVSQNLKIGQKVRATGELSLLDGATNLGGYDALSYNSGYGIFFGMKAGNIEVLSEDYNVLCQCIVNFKNRCVNMLSQALDGKDHGVYSSVLMGDKTSLEKSVTNLYRIGGISHILAISGLHISILGIWFYKLIRKILGGFLLPGVVSAIFICCYGYMTGFSFSTMRAVIMFVIMIGGEILGRKYDMLTAMGLALLFILAQNPYRIANGGVLLSFGAIVGVALGGYVLDFLTETSVIKKWKKQKGLKRLKYSLLTGVITSVSVSLITNPIIINLYHEIPLYSVFINVIIIPSFSAVVILGMVGCMLCFVFPRLGIIVLEIGTCFINLYGKICDIVSTLPFSRLVVGEVSFVWIFVYFLFLLTMILPMNKVIGKKLRDFIYQKFHYWFDKRKWYIFVLAWNIVLFIFGGVTLVGIYILNLKESVLFMDVGQGDGIIIRTEEGTNMVIDGGSSSMDQVGEYVIVPSLKYMGMGQVDYWFITHADIDHISGLMYILSSGQMTGIKVRNIVLSKYVYEDENLQELLDLAHSRKINVIYMKPQDFVTDGKFSMMCFFPTDTFKSEDKNQASLVLGYHSDYLDILFTGDIDINACEAMLRENSLPEEQFDIIKIPHHGSKHSNSNNLIGHVAPTYAIISCGENNIYGHPHKETLESLYEVGCKVLVTPKSGAILVEAR